MSARVRLRDAIASYLPWWLQNRAQAITATAKTVGFRFVWSIAAMLDAEVDVRIQGVEAARPGFGTPTALSLIGRSRGIIRGQGESDDNYGARLIPWLDRWRRAGSAEAVAQAIHEYLSDHPRVRVVNRSGRMVTCDTDGTLTTDDVAWDWDSVSNPERSGHWWDMWIIVYPTHWARDDVWGSFGLWGGDLGFGHDVPREDVDAILALIRQWKAEHSFVRAVIWSYNGSLFDPGTPASFPDGTWGKWHVVSGGVAVPSGRNVTDCRYWEGIS